MVDNRLDSNHNDFTYNRNFNDEFELKSAAGEISLNSSSIEQNATRIRRGFDSVNFRVNVSGFIDANQTFMHIEFTNGTSDNYNMSLVSGTSDTFTKTYSPSDLAPTGLQIVSFAIYNHSDKKYQLNTQTTLRNFTILPNAFWLPNGTANEYSKGEFLYADFIINNSDNFDWTLTVVDAIQNPQIPLFILGDNLYNFIFEINRSFDQINKFYYIKVDMDEISSGKSVTEYLQFKVLKPKSLITTVIFNPDSVFRGDTCSVQVNVSAIANDLNPIFINVSLELRDTNNIEVVNIPELNNDDINEKFESTFSVSVNSPAGIYDYTLIASYDDNDFDEYSGVLTVKNNPPDIDSYEINGIETDERISVLYGEDLVFEFDVFDEEGIQYITIKLIDQDDEDYEISREYESDLEITIRTEDLLTGTWTVYVSVTDTDGVTTELDSDYNTGPQEIEIIPDLLGDVLPWIMLFIGLIIGLMGVIVIALSKRSSKELAQTITKEKAVAKEKLTKPKREKKPKPVKKEAVKKKVEQEEVEEKEPEKIAPKRKIKRKLK